ncbi:MAG: dTDP-4-dehydrorhamnose 3,5-epimerase [Spirochaetaceae bacterium]|nr:MAG: dTDP-4-dehydrorhamnose 3,5-epimerase [Spirochaetaceae bacterium]
MPFTFQRLEIPDVILIKPRRFADERGWFMETFKESEFASNGITARFVQDNMSYSHRGVVRGLHYQISPAAQAKLVTIMKGEIFDVAVDVRKGSATFGRWVGAALSAERGDALFIPAGFAHGFAVTSDDALVVYKCDAEYAPDAERGILWSDPEIGIEWPVRDAIVSGKDQELPRLADAEPESRA